MSESVGKSARQIGSVAFFPDNLSVIRDHLAAQNSLDRPTGDLEPLVWCVVGAVMQNILRDRLAHFGIPQREVGVTADRDGTLLRIHPIELRLSRRGQIDELLNRDPSL